MLRKTKLHMINKTSICSNRIVGLHNGKKSQSQLSQSLNDPATSAKTYWTILKIFYSCNKIPLIPPLVINDQPITGFQERANLYFEKQCTQMILLL